MHTTRPVGRSETRQGLLRERYALGRRRPFVVPSVNTAGSLKQGVSKARDEAPHDAGDHSRESQLVRCKKFISPWAIRLSRRGSAPGENFWES